jgi:hypothetical protein
MLNSNDLRNLKIAATKSKHNYDTPSKERGEGAGLDQIKEDRGKGTPDPTGMDDE